MLLKSGKWWDVKVKLKRSTISVVPSLLGESWRRWQRKWKWIEDGMSQVRKVL
jgi:hypothetical protein